jgi:hypothetical protein
MDLTKGQITLRHFQKLDSVCVCGGGGGLSARVRRFVRMFELHKRWMDFDKI